MKPENATFEFSQCAIFGGGPLIEWDGKKSELQWRKPNTGSGRTIGSLNQNLPE